MAYDKICDLNDAEIGDLIQAYKSSGLRVVINDGYITNMCIEDVPSYEELGSWANTRYKGFRG